MKYLYYIFLLIILGLYFVSTIPAQALQEGDYCNPVIGQPQFCDAPLVCNPDPQILKQQKVKVYKCQKDTFGSIQPPEAVNNLGFGSLGISTVLNSIINLIYIFASIIFVFMVIISAVQWIMSGGDKENVGKARQRLTYAIIGIVILALTFVIASLIGQITNFQFFQGQITPPNMIRSGSPTPAPPFPRGAIKSEPSLRNTPTPTTEPPRSLTPAVNEQRLSQ